KYGVKFKYNGTIRRFTIDGDRISGVITDAGIEKADKVIMCLGSYSPLLLKKIGINVPIYPMKGYSISVQVDHPEGAPMMSITDQSRKLVYSRLGNILRVAGTAEFAGYDDKVNDLRVNSIISATQRMFPNASDFKKLTKWACLRPQT